MAITGNAEIVGSSSMFPYRKYDAFIYSDDNIQLIRGFAILEETSDVYKARIFGGNANIYDLIKDKKLSELKLSNFDHYWNDTVIFNKKSIYVGWESGFIYPDIDYGFWENIIKSSRPSKEFFLSFHVKKLIEKMFIEIGYYPFGDFWDNNELLNKMVLPFSGGKPKYNETYRKERYSYMLQNGVAYPSTTPGDFNNLVFNANTTNQWSYNSTTGQLNTQEKVYNANFTIRFKLYATFTTGAGGVSSGYRDFEFIIRLKNNTGAVIQTFSTQIRVDWGPSTGAIRNFELNFDGIKKVYGDYFFFDFGFNNLGGSNPLDLNLIEVKNASFIKIELAEEAYPGCLWNIASNLPDITCKELLTMVINQFCLLIDVNPETKQVNLIEFDSIIANKSIAEDWSDKLLLNKPPTIKYRLDDWAKNNEFKYLTDENDKYLINNPTYGIGYIGIDDDYLEQNKVVFEAKVAPIWRGPSFTDRPIDLAKIQMYKIDGNGVFQVNNIKPRVAYLEITETSNHDKLIAINTDTEEDQDNYIFGNGGSTTDLWPDKFFDVRFEKLRFKEYLIPNYNKALLQILDKLKIIELEFLLSYFDYANLRIDIPIYLNVEVAGYGTIDGYFYINELQEFIANKKEASTFELIRIN